MPYDKERYANDPIYRGNRQKAQRRWREAKRLKINAQKREDYAANPAVDPGLDQLSQQLPHRKEPAALGHRGRPVLFAAGTPLQNAALMWQRLEGAPDFLTNFGGGRADLTLFPVFRCARASRTDGKYRREFNGLPISAKKYERSSHFSLAYVTRVTYEPGTLHKCART